MKRIEFFGPYAYIKQSGFMAVEPFFAFGTWYVVIVLDDDEEKEPLVVKLSEVKVTQA